jgi:LCP family protein required for cell wall assembly
MTEEEMLIRQAVTEEANQAVDPRTVLAALRAGRQPRRRRTGLLVAVAGFAVAAAVVAVVVPLTVSREAAPLAPPAQQGRVAAPTEQNILLVGMDIDGGDNGRANADTVVLVRRTADGSFHALSLPRDSYVDIPGYGRHKLSSAYARGLAGKQDGRAVLVATVENLTGVKVDHYAFVNQVDFPKIATSVGGVEVCLKAATKDPLAQADFPAGNQVLTGDQALAFLRQRHNLPNGDLDRVARAQAFLRALVTKLAGSQNLPALVDAVKGSVTVDPAWNLLEFANQVVSGASTTTATVPYDSTPVQTPQDGDALGVDPATVKPFASDFLAGKGRSTGGGSGTPGVTCVS